VLFQNYYNATSPTINFAATGVTPASKEGLAVGSSLTAELLWFNGLTANPAALSLVAGSLTVFGTSVTAVSPVADGDLADGAGFFIAAASAVLPGYTSVLATFQVDVFGTEGLNSYVGQSALFTMTPATGAEPVPGFNQLQIAVGSIQYNPGSYSVSDVPEPTRWRWAPWAVCRSCCSAANRCSSGVCFWFFSREPLFGAALFFLR